MGCHGLEHVLTSALTTADMTVNMIYLSVTHIHTPSIPASEPFAYRPLMGLLMYSCCQHCYWCRVNAACAPRLDMTVAEFADWWRMHKAGKDSRLLYLKDWHFANQFPAYTAYETPRYFHQDWLNDFYDMKQAAQRQQQQNHGRPAGKSAAATQHGGCTGRLSMLTTSVLMVMSTCSVWLYHQDLPSAWSEAALGCQVYPVMPSSNCDSCLWYLR